MGLKTNLNRLMKEKSLTIKTLAQKTGISEPTLKRLKTKDSNPTLDILIRLANTLDTNINALIDKENSIQTFHQDTDIPIKNIEDEFVLLFTKKTFSFNQGTKAVFKKYSPEEPVTKYIIDLTGKILEKIDGERMLFQNENFQIFSIEKEKISACIVKELYEVYYV